MAARKKIHRRRSPARKVRKPIAPPTRVHDDARKYRRSRERRRARRETEEN